MTRGTGALGLVRAEVPVAPDAPTAEDWLRQELARSEYHPHESPVEWVLRHLTDLFDRATSAAGSGGTATWIVAGVLVALVVGLVILVGPMRRRRRAASPGQVAVLDATTTTDQWQAQSDRAWAAEDWSTAFVAAYRGIVQDAVDRVVVEPWPGLTAHEAATSLGRALPEVAERMLAAAATFDAVAYGSATASRQDAATVRELARQVRGTRLRASAAVPAGDPAATSAGGVL